MARLAEGVNVFTDDGRLLLAGAEVDEADARTFGAHVFEGGVHPFPDEADDDEGGELDGVPAKGGPGSGTKLWAAYAAEHKVDVPEGASRDEIIAALEAAKVPTEKSE